MDDTENSASVEHQPQQIATQTNPPNQTNHSEQIDQPTPNTNRIEIEIDNYDNPTNKRKREPTKSKITNDDDDDDDDNDDDTADDADDDDADNDDEEFRLSKKHKPAQPSPSGTAAQPRVSTRPQRQVKKPKMMDEAPPPPPPPKPRKPRRKPGTHPQGEFASMLNRVRSALSTIRREQLLVDVYQREYNSELVKPSQDLSRAMRSIRRAKRRIRQIIRQAEEFYKDKMQLPTDSFDPDGIDVELITCSICGSGDSTETNDVVLCDRAGCNRAFHQLCLNPPVSDVSTLPDDWFCPSCDCVLDCLDEVNYDFETEYQNWREVFPEVPSDSEPEEIPAAPTPTKRKRPQNYTVVDDDENNKNSDEDIDDDFKNHNSDTGSHLSGEVLSEHSGSGKRRTRRKAGLSAMSAVSNLIQHESNAQTSTETAQIVRWLEGEDDSDDQDFDTSKIDDANNNGDGENNNNDNTDDGSHSDKSSNSFVASGEMLSESFGRGKRHTSRPDYQKLLDQIQVENQRSGVVLENEDEDSDFDPQKHDQNGDDCA